MQTLIRADFASRVVVDTAMEPWLDSPESGVARRPLDRIGGEVARATSIVRYAPASRFAPHVHGAGEEFLVLEGVFSDENGDYPAGTYVRNPPGSKHSPFSTEGCVIFVKLRQMRADDDRRVVVEADARGVKEALARDGRVDLFRSPDGAEIVELLKLAPGESLAAVEAGHAEEVLVLEGALTEAGGAGLPVGAWTRSPPGEAVALTSPAGAMVWRKQLRGGYLW